MLEGGIIVRPAFDLPQHLRVTVGLPELNQALVAALGEAVA
jgi:histidinol-phosphate/aromatic aminotransferase/cobyric acid decarboxylase-like protein